MNLTIDVWAVIVLVLGYVASLITSIIYLKTEIAKIKEWKSSFEAKFNESNERHEKENNKLLDQIKEMQGEQKSMRDLFSAQLYDLNSKITRAATIIEMEDKHKHSQH